MSENRMPSLNSEEVAYWYFRLNGFFTFKNFIVHPDKGSNQGTDIDVLAVRFPYRSENLLVPMEDDPKIVDQDAGITLYLAEVKTRVCNLNDSWTNREKLVMERVMRAVGLFPLDEVPQVARHLYDRGIYSNDKFKVSWLCIGEVKNPKHEIEYPKVQQLLWIDVAKFIFNRLKGYQPQKSSTRQWDETGRTLWQVARHSESPEEFWNSFELRSE